MLLDIVMPIMDGFEMLANDSFQNHLQLKFFFFPSYNNLPIYNCLLLAEDNDLNWEIAEDILSEAGFELERAENGQICVEKFQQSDVWYFDVIHTVFCFYNIKFTR